MAVLAAVFTLPLLFVGGSVTTYRVGMAVPDWPTTFGINMFLYDFWNAPFGVRVEHAHRLYGAAVGLATIVLTVWFLAFEPRRWMKVLGVVALVAVIVQGILGGTASTQISTFLAAVHGCTGQAFFGLMVALCVLTGRDWSSARAGRPRHPHGSAARALVMLALVYGQIVLGAWLRHYGTLGAAGRARPCAAVVVCGPCAASPGASSGTADDVPRSCPPARVLAAAAMLQVVLWDLAASSTCSPSTGFPARSASTRRWSGPATRPTRALLLASSRRARPARAPAPAGRRRARRRGSPAHDGLRQRIGAGEPGGRRLKTAVSFGQPGLAAVLDRRPSSQAGPASSRPTSRSPSRRIVVMVLVTVGVGFLLGARGSAHPATLSLTLLGTAWWRRRQHAEPVDGAGTRRADAADGQPGPAHGPASPRSRPRSSARAGASSGTVDPALAVPTAWRRRWPSATLLLYVLVYTPLKPRTTLNTAIGAVPGALPPVIGWAAATGTLGIEAFALFLIVFLWQFPHFLAIAWIYREDYARGGHEDASGGRPARGAHRPAGHRLRPGAGPRRPAAGASAWPGRSISPGRSSWACST